MPPSRHHPRRPASAVHLEGFRTSTGCLLQRGIPARDGALVFRTSAVSDPVARSTRDDCDHVETGMGRLSRRRFLRTAERAVGARAVVGQRGLFLSMVVRYGVTMTLHPEYRWFGHTIPIWFHMVLAAYLYFYSRFHYQLSARQDSPIGGHMTVAEPAVTLTDFALALECLVLTALIATRATSDETRRSGSSYFSAAWRRRRCSTASSTASSPTSIRCHAIFWNATLIAIGVTALATWIIVSLLSLRGRGQCILQRAAIVIFALYTASIIGLNNSFTLLSSITCHRR